MITEKNRVLIFIEYLKLPKSTTIKSIGLNYSNFTGKSKNSSLCSSALVKLLKAFPNLNLDWLLTGKGEMFINKNESKQEYEILTDEFCIDFLKKTGKYNIYKITETAI